LWYNLINALASNNKFEIHLLLQFEIQHKFSKNIKIHYSYNNDKNIKEINEQNAVCIGTFQTFCKNMCNAIMVYDLVPGNLYKKIIKRV
jgi:hypothetical protein